MEQCPPAYSDNELYNNTVELIKKFSIKKIYETGTHVGGSALILSKIDPNIKIYSYEVHNGWYNEACNRCKNQPNVTINQKSSPEGLKIDLIEDDKDILFFLDAHWHNYWPILDELKVIQEKKITPCIIIHDFYIPNGNGGTLCGYDEYNGQPLSLEYIKPSIDKIFNNNYNYFYSKTFTMNRGSVYITPTKNTID